MPAYRPSGALSESAQYIVFKGIEGRSLEGGRRRGCGGGEGRISNAEIRIENEECWIGNGEERGDGIRGAAGLPARGKTKWGSGRTFTMSGS